MNNEDMKLKSAAELAMEKTSPVSNEAEAKAAEGVSPQEEPERKLKTAAELAMEKTKDILSETGAESSISASEKKLKTAKEVGMEKADAILREAKNEVAAKKTEEYPADSLSAMKERLERLKQINPEEGMFQSIGTKKERKKALAEMISELEGEISAKEVAEKGEAQISAQKRENGERLERLREINPGEGVFSSVGTEKERQEALKKMISELERKTGGTRNISNEKNAKSAAPEIKKTKGGFWRRLFGGS